MAKQTPHPNIINKQLRYCIATRLVDFDPEKLGPKTIIYNNRLAIRLKGRIYTKT